MCHEQKFQGQGHKSNAYKSQYKSTGLRDGQ